MFIKGESINFTFGCVLRLLMERAGHVTVEGRTKHFVGVLIKADV